MASPSPAEPLPTLALFIWWQPATPVLSCCGTEWSPRGCLSHTFPSVVYFLKKLVDVKGMCPSAPWAPPFIRKCLLMPPWISLYAFWKPWLRCPILASPVPLVMGRGPQVRGSYYPLISQERLGGLSTHKLLLLLPLSNTLPPHPEPRWGGGATGAGRGRQRGNGTCLPFFPYLICSWLVPERGEGAQVVGYSPWGCKESDMSYI